MNNPFRNNYIFCFNKGIEMKLLFISMTGFIIQYTLHTKLITAPLIKEKPAWLNSITY